MLQVHVEAGGSKHRLQALHVAPHEAVAAGAWHHHGVQAVASQHFGAATGCPHGSSHPRACRVTASTATACAGHVSSHTAP
eukprot:353404-Chlamydomonas_euryale.AAC.1